MSWKKCVFHSAVAAFFKPLWSSHTKFGGQQKQADFKFQVTDNCKYCEFKKMF